MTVIKESVILHDNSVMRKMNPGTVVPQEHNSPGSQLTVIEIIYTWNRGDCVGTVSPRTLEAVEPS